ncbi:MAG: phosphoribosylamine--glycine ligase, partial [Flavobacteriaceae bacterium]|nr:phosphoribosylamine--glycine ligase [Flavobacteriaceae bacterium]
MKTLQNGKNHSHPKRKFLFVSRWGEIMDIAYAVQEEGNEVKFFIEDKASREIGFGFVKQVKKWEKHQDWADVIVFDYTGYGKVCDELRAKGHKVFGGSEYTDLLELDRNFGQTEMKKLKIKVLPSKEFNSFQEAIVFVEQNPDAYVIKPS